MAGATNDPAHRPFVNRGPGQLMRPAHECIGGGPHTQALFGREVLQLFSLVQRQDQRLFGIGVFAGLKDAPRHIVMHRRHRQVDDHIDILGGQQIIHRIRPDIIFRRPRLCRTHVDIGHRRQFQ